MDDAKKVLPIRMPQQALVRPITGLRIGKVVGTDAKGQFFVDYDGNDHGHMPARLTSTASENLLQGSQAGQEVLLGIEDDTGHAVIIDTLHSPADETREACSDLFGRDPKQITLDAKEELVLRCGEASITLTSAGKVFIKGSYLISRSSGTNSIKGSSVRIN